LVQGRLQRGVQCPLNGVVFQIIAKINHKTERSYGNTRINKKKQSTLVMFGMEVKQLREFLMQTLSIEKII
jgi:hypothetical protein